MIDKVDVEDLCCDVAVFLKWMATEYELPISEVSVRACSLRKMFCAEVVSSFPTEAEDALRLFENKKGRDMTEQFSCVDFALATKTAVEAIVVAYGTGGETGMRFHWVQTTIALLQTVINTTIQFSGLHNTEMLSVRQSCVERWEQFMHNTANHDLEIKTRTTSVYAPAAFLRSASPMINAALSCPMQESQNKCLSLVEFEKASVQAVVEAACLGELPSENVQPQILLEAMEITRMWLMWDLHSEFVNHARFTVDNISIYAQAAKQRNIEQLLYRCFAACQLFLRNGKLELNKLDDFLTELLYPQATSKSIKRPPTHRT